MKKRNWIKVTSILLSVGLFIVLVGCTKKVPEPPVTESPQAAESKTKEVVLEKDKPAPDFELEDLEGNIIKPSDFKGQYVLINFWATWCGFCEREIPDLIAFDQKYDDITVLPVDYMEAPQAVRTYLDKKGFKMNSLLDSEGSIGALYAVTSFPTTYVLDKQGNLVAMIQGMTTAEELEKLRTYLHDKYPK